jgi:hypothetical protein
MQAYFFSRHRTAAMSAYSIAAVFSTSAMAQQNPIQFRCDYEFVSAAAVPAAPVPSMTLLGVALLVAMVAFVGWRMGRFPGARLMSVVLVVAAAVLANQGGGGLVQKAYAAALSFTNTAGETLTGSDLYSSNITLTNNSNVPLLLKTVNIGAWPQGQMGSCSEGITLAPGASCSGSLSCAASCRPNEIFSPLSTQGCVCDSDSGMIRDENGDCVSLDDPNYPCLEKEWGDGEYICTKWPDPIDPGP